MGAIKRYKKRVIFNQRSYMTVFMTMRLFSLLHDRSRLRDVQRQFRRPQIVTWNSIRDDFGSVEIKSLGRRPACQP
jgi:hypothetical protein